VTTEPLTNTESICFPHKNIECSFLLKLEVAERPPSGLTATRVGQAAGLCSRVV
jgi:hypothetical protein